MNGIDAVRHFFGLCKSVFITGEIITLGRLGVIIRACGFQENFKLCAAFGCFNLCFAVITMLNISDIALDNPLVHIVCCLIVFNGVVLCFCTDRINGRIKQISLARCKFFYCPIVPANILLAHKLTVFVGVVFVNELIALENAVLSPCKRSIALFVSGFGVALGYGHGKLFERVRKITACNLIPLDRCVLLFGNNITDCGIHFFNGIRLSAGDKDTFKGCHTVCIGYGILVNGNA